MNNDETTGSTTYHDGDDDTDQPELEDDEEFLSHVPDDPPDASQYKYDPVEDQLRQFLSLVVHNDNTNTNDRIVPSKSVCVRSR